MGPEEQTFKGVRKLSAVRRKGRRLLRWCAARVHLSERSERSGTRAATQHTVVQRKSGKSLATKACDADGDGADAAYSFALAVVSLTRVFM